MTDETRVETIDHPVYFQLTPTRYGRMLVPPTDEYVGQALLTYGEYSQLELDVLQQFVLPQTRVVVAGANLGALVVPLAQRAGEVIAFEPQRWVFQLLCANVALNNLLNVKAYWAGLGAKQQVIKVPCLDPAKRNNFGAYELAMGEQAGGEPVPVFKLDSLPVKDVGLFVIDVEGMELQVLQGAEQLVAASRPLIWFEADRQLKRAAVFRWLRDREYDVYWARTWLFNPSNFNKVAENRYPNIVAENAFAVPREKEATIHGFDRVTPEDMTE